MHSRTKEIVSLSFIAMATFLLLVKLAVKLAVRLRSSAFEALVREVKPKRYKHRSATVRKSLRYWKLQPWVRTVLENDKVSGGPT